MNQQKLRRAARKQRILNPPPRVEIRCCLVKTEYFVGDEKIKKTLTKTFHVRNDHFITWSIRNGITTLKKDSKSSRRHGRS